MSLVCFLTMYCVNKGKSEYLCTNGKREINFVIIWFIG